MRRPPLPALSRLGLVLLAAAAALVPIPPDIVEAAYSATVYPLIQHTLTPLSNRAPVAILDILLVLAAMAIVLAAIRRLRRSGLRGLGWLALDLAAIVAGAYLVFLLTWGLNYRRPPLTAKLDHDGARISAAVVAAFSRRAVDELNRLGPVVDEQDWPSWDGMPAMLGAAAARAHRAVGAAQPASLAVPRPTLLSWYFQQAGVDGMTDPFALETLVNTALLPTERPFVVAHEWAHLAGYADESEANFVGWLTGLMGDDRAQYSAWLAIYPYAVDAMPRGEARTLSQQLGEIPRRDLRAISARRQRASRTVSRAATSVYDRYLKANRVEAGIRSYAGVLAIVTGTRFNEDGTPMLRPSSGQAIR